MWPRRPATATASGSTPRSTVPTGRPSVIGCSAGSTPSPPAGSSTGPRGPPNLELIRGTARFVGDRRVIEVDGRSCWPPTQGPGGHRLPLPVMPPIPGLDEVRVHTSDTIMRLDRLPERLAIIGGGFIATEMGHVFSGYGSRGHPVQPLEHACCGPRTSECLQPVHRGLRPPGRPPPRPGARPGRTGGRRHPGSTAGRARSSRPTRCWWPPGRIPNSDLVDAEAGGLERPRRRHGSRSTTPWPPVVEGVWAIGDVSQRLPAQAPGQRRGQGGVLEHGPTRTSSATRRLPGRAPRRVQRSPGGDGRADRGAGERPPAGDFVVGRRDYGGTAYGWALEDQRLVRQGADRRSTLGCRSSAAHIVGPQAASLIQPLDPGHAVRPAGRGGHRLGTCSTSTRPSPRWWRTPCSTGWSSWGAGTGRPSASRLRADRPSNSRPGSRRYNGRSGKWIAGPTAVGEAALQLPAYPPVQQRFIRCCFRCDMRCGHVR